EVRHLEEILPQVSISPHVVQVERHPLNSATDIIKYCHDREIAVQGYSPVCRMLPKVARSETLTRIANKHGKTVGQVILRWHVEWGVAPVFMTTRKERFSEYCTVEDFNLDESDISAIDSL